MSFREEIKVKKDYFMKDYTKEEILRIFTFMSKRMGRTEEINGELEEMKITEIDGDIITVETKMKDEDKTRLYKFSLQFDKMENQEFTREAKIASPERTGKAIELKETATEEEKEMYFEEVVDYWDEKEKINERIKKAKQPENFFERYTKENIIKIADVMIETSINSEEMQGKIVDRKIVKIEETTVSVVIKTKDNKEQIRVYRLNLDFDKMKNASYTNDAKISSVIRVGSAIELKNQIGNEEKEDYYDRLPDFFDKEKEEAEVEENR